MTELQLLPFLKHRSGKHSSRNEDNSMTELAENEWSHAILIRHVGAKSLMLYKEF